MKQNLINRILTAFVLIYCSHSAASDSNAIDQTYVFFPFAHAEIRPDVHDNPELETFEVELGTDFFYLLNYKKFRVLGELAVTSEEFELERLQIGLDLTTNQTLWLGRFHTPLGYWNSNYHHGLHLQTSVHRPGIIEFEEKGGALPNHITGALLEGQRFTNNGAINYSAAIGYAPTLEHDTLEPYSLEASGNKLHGIIKIGYQPDETNPSESGLVIAQSTITHEGELIDQIQQQFVSLYSHQSWEKYRLLGAAFLVKNTIQYPSTDDAKASFAAGYLHGEYDIASQWTVYARVERSLGSEDDSYLALFEHSETQRNLGGIRYDVTRRQAISSEVSQRTGEHDNHTHVSIQWSAVFP
ncbi:MAG: hypothetical protein OEX07_06195 [Gammaproteobacteria bacterium]|nr:hypothetical protein [Gammaproteobacteria bacterium]